MALPPRLLTALALLGIVWAGQGLAGPKSIETIERLLQECPDSAGLYAELASLHFDESTIEGRRRAIGAMKQALRIEPRNPDYHVMLAEILLASTFWHYGVEELKQALEIDPAHDAAHYLLGKAYLDRALEGWQRKWFRNAETELGRVDEGSAWFRDACRYRAQCLFDLDLVDSALAVMKEVNSDSLDCQDQLLIGMLYWKKGDLEKAWDWFDRALEGLNQSKRNHYVSIDLIASDRDKELLKVGSAEGDIDLYWRMHDPDPATEVNERLVEHIARVVFADLHFSVPRLNKPGSQTARGEVLIRYGMPLRWSYDPFGSGLVADETVPPLNFEQSGFALDLLSETYDPGERYRSRPLRVSKPVWTWHYADFTLNFEDTFLNGDFDFPYERDWSAYVYAYVTRRLPEIYETQIRKHMNVVLDAIAFLDSAGAEAVRLIYGADTRGVTYVQKMRWPTADFKVQIAVLDSLHNRIVQREIQTRLRADSSSLYLAPYPLIGTYTVTLPKGSHIAAVSLRSLSNQAAGSATSTVHVRDMKSRLALSNIELRFDEDGPPNPSHIFLERSKVFMDFEVYNLACASDGLYRADVSYCLKRRSGRQTFTQRLMRILTGKPTYTVITAFAGSYTTVAARSRTEVVLGIDLSELSRGEYVLEVVVTDLVSGEKATARTSLTVASDLML